VSAHAAEDDVGAPDAFLPNAGATVGSVDHVPIPGIDTHVVDVAAGVEEDKVAQTPGAPRDMDGGVVLLLGGAGQDPAGPVIGELGQAGTVEPGPRPRSPIPIGDTYFAGGDTECGDSDSGRYRRVGGGAGDRVQGQGEAKESCDQHREEAPGQG